MAEIKFENGQYVTGLHGSYCGLCSYSFGGSATICAGKYLDGKFYHLECYPKAVDIFLADKKIEKYNKNNK